MPAAALCQAPAKWEMLCLGPVGSNQPPIPPRPPLKSFGMESYRVLQPALHGASACTENLLGQRTSKEMEKSLQKNKQTNKSSVEMMSSEQESYTSNISHQAQVSTTYVVSLLLSRIPCNCLAEIAVGLAQRNRCGLMRLTGFLKQCNSSLLKGFVMSYTGHKSSSPWGRMCTSVQRK